MTLKKEVALLITLKKSVIQWNAGRCECIDR